MHPVSKGRDRAWKNYYIISHISYDDRFLLTCSVSFPCLGFKLRVFSQQISSVCSSLMQYDFCPAWDILNALQTVRSSGSLFCATVSVEDSARVTSWSWSSNYTWCKVCTSSLSILRQVLTRRFHSSSAVPSRFGWWALLRSICCDSLLQCGFNRLDPCAVWVSCSFG